MMENNNSKSTLFDAELIKRYSKPGPRYTSYPTAPMFSEAIGPIEFRNEIAKTNNSTEPVDLSLYFHIPFCDTLCYFCACNMLITHDDDKKENYLRYLKKEIDMIAELTKSDRKVSQMHWGGGTPSYLPPSQIVSLGKYIRESFTFDDDAEVSVEIDPRGLTREHLEAFKEIGFNRISMGVQDFDPEVQEAINRIQPEDMTIQVVDWCRELGFKSINLDLIYGLPHQNVEKFRKTVRSVIDIKPDRIATFNYAHVPWMKKHQTIIKDEWLPSTDEKLKLLHLVIDEFTSAGYEFIGMDHFAFPEDEIVVAQNNGTLHRNFQGYSTKKGCDLIAMGITGISEVGDIYAQNVKTLDEYYEIIDSGELTTFKGYKLSHEDQLRKEIIMQLMCHFYLDKKSIGDAYNLSFDEHFSDALEAMEPMREDGLLEITEDSITVLPVGRLLIRNITMAFDEYLTDKKEKEFSKTI